MRRSGIWFWLAISLIVPFLFLAVTFAMCGVGHGDCRLLIAFPVLFPYATLFSTAFPNQMGILLVLALGQFPLYVLALARLRGTPRYGLVRNLILAAHALTVVVAFIVWP